MHNRIEYRLLAEAIPSIIWVADPGGNVEYFNSRWLEYTGLTPNDGVGTGWRVALHPDDLETYRTKRAVTLETGETFHMELRLRRYDGQYHWFLLRAEPVRESDGTIAMWFGAATDIEEQKHAEKLLLFFARTGSALGASLDPAVIANNMARLLVPEFADYAQVFALTEDDDLMPLAVVHRDDTHREYLREMNARWPLSKAAPALAHLLKHAEPVMVPEVTATMRGLTARDPEHHAMLELIGAHSSIVLPLVSRGVPCGVLSMVYATSGRRYGSRDLSLALEIGRRLALALDNANRYQHEHRIANALQDAILPRDLPTVPGARLRSLYIPGESELQVGGDWFDAFELPSGLLGLSIGDVTGHGLAAAVVMGEIRQALRSSAIEANAPSHVLDHADRALRLQRPETIATAGFGIYDPADRTLTYAHAGHPAPLVCKPDGTVYAVEADGLPLGMRNLGPCSATTVALEPGSLVAFYTDGLIEFNRNAEEGERALREAMRVERVDPSANPAFGLYRRVVTEDATHADDTAILTLQVE